jgi:hypothetical protein
MKFSNFIYDQLFEKELYENSLYANDAERDAIAADKSKVVEAFIVNFIGMLGLINGATHKRDITKLKAHFMTDKKVQLDSIGSENNDMSISLKLLADSDMFLSNTTPKEITRFLARLKQGKVEPIDSRIVAGWLKKIKPEFLRHIKDPQIRLIMSNFIKDEGETIDVSSIAVLLKKKIRKLDMKGEFDPFAKRVTLVSRDPIHITDEKIPEDDLISSNRAKAFGKSDNATIVDNNKDKKIDPVVQVKAPEPGLSLKLHAYDFQFLIKNFISMKFRNINRVLAKLRLPKSDIEYIEKIREELDSLISKIVKLEVDNLVPAIKDLAEKINAAKFSDTIITEDELINYISYDDDINYFSSHYAAKKYPLLGIYKFEKDNNVSFFDITDIATVYDSPYGNSKKLIKERYNNLEYKNILDPYFYRMDPIALRSSNPYIYREMRVLIDYLLKIHYSGSKLIDIINELKGEMSGSYALKQIYEKMLLILSNETIPSANIFGINLKFIFDRHKSEIKALSLNDLPDAFLKAGLDDYAKKRKESIIFPFYKEKYEQDININGLEKSQIFKDSIFSRNKLDISGKFLDDLNIDLKKLDKKFPNDSDILNIRAVKDGIDSLSESEIKHYVISKTINMFRSTDDYSNTHRVKRFENVSDEELKKSPEFADFVVINTKDIFRKTGDSLKVGNSFISIVKENPGAYDNSSVFDNLMHMLPSFDKKTVIDMIKIAKENNYTKFFNPAKFKNERKRAKKDEFVSILTGIMHDCIGNDAEDYMSDLLDIMPGGVINKIRGNLLGMQTLIDEVNIGEIKPFGAIDDKRLKIMLSMNDINFAALVRADVGRKKKNEKWLDYFKRASDASKISNKKVLGDEKVSLPVVDKKILKKTTDTINKTTRSGKHGDNYAKINKTYSSNLKFPEFDNFRKTNPGDGTIEPAFHGTGGIAATMILRYGFKIIKSSDSSVVGRMLGDGIYFSNKIDKAMQYVGNSGYGRSYGTKGYIFVVDNNLGKKDLTNKNGPDYRVMGLGNDHIRSPEWCVRDPKAQIAVHTVHEVELASESMIDKYLKENNSGLSGFKSFLYERKALNMQNNVTSFIFRDGLIPIFDQLGQNVEFVDFEDALEQKLILPSMIDYSMQGPVVVFDEADETKTYDIRFADVISGEEYNTYRKLFMDKMYSTYQ